MKDQDFITLNKRNMRVWFLLSFQAGAINAGGFIACKRFVTHTTGFATHFSFDIARWHWMDALSMLSVPLFFLIGAMISSFHVDLPLKNGAAPNYRLPAAYMFVCLGLATVLGEMGVFGIFGAQYTVATDYLFMVLLCLASGLQNALITNANGVVVRTTHLTGVTTDLAVGLVRLLHTSPQDRHFTHEQKAVMARVAILGGFILGGTLSAFLFLKAEYWGFLLPVFTSLLVLKYFMYRT